METTSVFFFWLLAGLFVVFAGLRAAGVSAERIGRDAALVLAAVLDCMPVPHRLSAFMQRYRKAVAVVGVVAAIFFAPSLVAAILLVAILAAVRQVATILLVAILADVKQPGDAGASDPAADAGTISGVLVDHGKAPYMNDNNNSPSYYVELMRGDQTKVVWGVGLAGAIDRAGANWGDTISLKHIGRRATMVPQARPEDGTRPVWKRAMRNSWDVVIQRSGA